MECQRQLQEHQQALEEHQNQEQNKFQQVQQVSQIFLLSQALGEHSQHLAEQYMTKINKDNDKIIILLCYCHCHYHHCGPR
jgi:serine/threonine protein phosphatase PrpC